MLVKDIITLRYRLIISFTNIHYKYTLWQGYHYNITLLQGLQIRYILCVKDIKYGYTMIRITNTDYLYDRI